MPFSIWECAKRVHTPYASRTCEGWHSSLFHITISMFNITGYEMEWDIQLTNQIDPSYSTTLTSETYLSVIGCPFHHITLTITEGEDTVFYEGIPLFVLLSIFDGDDTGTHYGGFNYTFNEALATSGYTIKVIAEDDFARNFTSQDVSHNNDIIVAYMRNGALLDAAHGPLRIIGLTLEGQDMVAQIKEIQIIPNGT